MIPVDQSVLGVKAVGRVLPSSVSFIDEFDRLPFDETNVFINGMVFSFAQRENIQAQEELLVRLSESLQSFGIEWPPNYLQDFEAFQEVGQEMIKFLRNANNEQSLEFHIKLFETILEDRRSLMDSLSDHVIREQTRQGIENLNNMSNEELEAYSSDLIQQVESSFTRLYFELFSDREKGIIYFKNVLKHEMGHTLGLANLSEDDIDITGQTQMPLMWYNIEGGIDLDDPAAYFDNPLKVDRYTLHALSCNYDLEFLREQAQQL